MHHLPPSNFLSSSENRTGKPIACHRQPLVVHGHCTTLMHYPRARVFFLMATSRAAWAFHFLHLGHFLVSKIILRKGTLLNLLRVLLQGRTMPSATPHECPHFSIITNHAVIAKIRPLK